MQKSRGKRPRGGNVQGRKRPEENVQGECPTPYPCRHWADVVFFLFFMHMFNRVLHVRIAALKTVAQRRIISYRLTHSILCRDSVL